MDDFFSKAKKLSHEQSKQIAALCGAAAVLLLIASFVAGGGVARLGTSLALNGISPASQPADINCLVFGSQCNGTNRIYYGISANTTTVTSGQSASLTWTAYSTVNGVLSRGSCLQNYYPQFNCSISNYGAVGDQYIPPVYDDQGDVIGGGNEESAARSGTVTVTPAQTTTYTFCAGEYYTVGGATSYPPPCPSVTVTVTCPSGYSGTPPNCSMPPPPPPTPTVLTSFTANPPTVVSGNSSTLAWTGAKGTLFVGCDLRGGQWGNGTWFGALPGSIATNPLITTTTYNISCVDSNGTATGWNPGTVVVTNPPPPPSCSNGLNIGSYPSCTCPANQTQSGSSCVAIACPSGDTGTYPNCVAPAPTCSNGLAGSYAPGCTCPSGQVQSGSICITAPVITCSNGLPNSYAPGCTCPSGQVQSGSSCVAVGVIQNFTANPSRVLKGNTAAISWSTTNMALCSVTALTSAGTTVLSNALSSTADPVINSKTVFTLSCGDHVGASYSASQTVNLIPQEIEQ